MAHTDRIIEAHELDGKLNVTVECCGISTHVISLPATADRKAVRDALRAQLKEMEDRERRKVPRKDLIGDL